MADKYNGAFTGAQIDEAIGKALNGTLMNAETYDPQGKATDIFKYVDEHASGGGGSGVHIGPEPPTNGETVWIDTDKNAVKYLNPTTGEWETASAPTEVKGMTMDLLWTNPDPDAEFAAQTINVQHNSQKSYDYALFELRTFPASNRSSFCLIASGFGAMALGESGGGSTAISRRKINSSAFGVYEVDTAALYGSTGWTNTDARLMPYRIYGLRNTSTSNPVGTGTIESINHPGCFYRMVNGVQEWLNPPMELGVEYKTTERYLGKPVYTKVVDCGALPNKSVKIYAAVESGVIDQVVSFSAATNDSANGKITLPGHMAGSTPDQNTLIFADFSASGYIKITTFYDMSGYKSCLATCKYTKTTD